MRIVLDLQACQSGSRLGGIGRYSQNLAEALARQAGGHELRILLNDLLPDSIHGIYQRFASLLPRQQIQVFQVPGPVAECDPANQPRARAAELIRESFIHQLDPDLVHVSSLIEGLGDDVVVSVGRLMPGDATSVTLYDLIPLVDRDRYLIDPVTTAHYYRKLEDLQRAGLLLAISEFSRQQAIAELGIDPERIVNIAAGVDDQFRPLVVPEARAAAVRRRYGIPRSFLLYTSSFDQRKNHARLIQAYARLPQSLRASRQLVIIGNGWDGIYAHLRQIGQRAGLDARELVFPGHVPDDDLLALYNLCDLFVFPSLSEGYGLPALEAMACGIPTLGSNVTSIPEVIGWDEALFDPWNIDSIAGKMHQALADSGFRQRLRDHGLAYSRKFTWDATARTALRAFEALHERVRSATRPSRAIARQHTVAALASLIRQSPAVAREVPRLAAALAANESCLVDVRPRPPRIGWITPWNTRCGIAMYARHLAGAHLPDYVILAPHEPETVLPDEDNVIRCWRAGDDDLRALAERIHDGAIDTLIIQFNYSFFDFAALTRFLQEMIATGRRLYLALHATTDPPEKPLGQLAAPLALCDAVFVHSPHDHAVLARIGLERNVERFPHGVADVAPAPVEVAIPPGRFVVASYGFFLPHKGLLELIDVCRDLVDAWGCDAHLLMINAEYPVPVSRDLIAQARTRIAQRGLADRVTLVPDFLDDAVSLGYLRHADLIVYPYQETGESSSAAVRMGLAARRPVAVTPLKIFDDVRDGVFVLPGVDRASIARAIAALRPRLQAPDEAVRQTLAHAAQWLDAHRYSRLAEALWSRLNER